VLADLCGKGQRIRTVAVPLWVKQGINAWLTAARIEEGVPSECLVRRRTAR